MNTYKLRDIISHISNSGILPTDAYGQRLGVNELMDWFGLTENLTGFEQIEVKRELALLIEAELYVERLKQAEQLYEG
ncbi:MAG: hypothetical protein ABIG61_04275 [Planctomycetota bacterium]